MNLPLECATLPRSEPLMFAQHPLLTMNFRMEDCRMLKEEWKAIEDGLFLVAAA
jgi:hypothetical protein